LPFYILEERMKTQTEKVKIRQEQVTVEDVNRLLEVGRLLFSVLTPEEIEQLQDFLSPQNKLGNTGDS